MLGRCIAGVWELWLWSVGECEDDARVMGMDSVQRTALGTMHMLGWEEDKKEPRKGIRSAESQGYDC